METNIDARERVYLSPNICYSWSGTNLTKSVPETPITYFGSNIVPSGIYRVTLSCSLDVLEPSNNYGVGNAPSVFLGLTSSAHGKWNSLGSANNSPSGTGSLDVIKPFDDINPATHNTTNGPSDLLSSEPTIVVQSTFFADNTGNFSYIFTLGNYGSGSGASSNASFSNGDVYQLYPYDPLSSLTTGRYSAGVVVERLQ